ncbi:hypothetical protein ER308_13695 [Egibacter rhizosphaerae]|uniref:Tripartite tricarboxylate transporter substrate binding protein n=1 Tax=Egibacter rhizosphaerae TaxID=1670831 RepID=A0A411YH09_9ACTN|nr:hypothetical protein [Egibacter rhizosphaerae]QBI20513.1 hypothetical protein ER308_13695 [Egibacter rhizosphaerae]
MRVDHTTSRKPSLRVILAAIFALALLLAACETDDAEDIADPDEEPDEEPDDDEPDDDEPDDDEPDDEDDEEPEEAEADVDEEDVDEGAFYHDQEVEIIMPFGAGGGTDTQGRFMAPFLAENVPGNPTVQPVNIAGAGGTIGNNQFALERDHEEATSVLFSSGSSFFPWVFMEEALELDYEELVGVFGVQTGGLVYADAELVDDTDDFIERYDEITFEAGEQTPDSLAAPFLLAYDMLDMDVNVVMGYEGRGPARSAFEGGEIDLNWDTTASVPDNVDPLIEAGDAVPLFSVGQFEDGELVDDPVFSEEYGVPPFHEVYEEIHGQPLEEEGPMADAYAQLVNAGFSLQKVMWLHQDAPDEAVEDLTEGFHAMTEDPEFQEEAEEVLDTDQYDLTTGDDVAPAVEDLITWEDEVVNTVLDFLVENYDHPDPRE